MCPMAEHYTKAGAGWIVKKDAEPVLSAATPIRFVSFPRTGSHHIRQFLELYFERPLLPTTFFFPQGERPLFVHDHDPALNMSKQNTIYLYRNPVDTIFSYTLYFPNTDATKFITTVRSGQSNAILNEYVQAATIKYFAHLQSWLVDAPVTADRCVLYYDAIAKGKPELRHSELARVVRFLGGDWSKNRGDTCWKRLTKDVAARITEGVGHRTVVVHSATYEEARKLFRERFKEQIIEKLKEVPKLAPWLNTNA